MNTNTKLIDSISATPAVSAWRKGVKAYAVELVEGAETISSVKGHFLNGARTWKEFSEGGCSLIYDADIAERLCSPSEFKKTRNGERAPNSRESWLDVQARALFQAENLIISTLKK